MAQQKPGVMLYFEMRNVFEELSNEKRGILVSAILDYSEHGIQPDFRGSLRIAWASIQPRLDRDDENYAHKSQLRRYAVYVRESKKDGTLPLTFDEWLASLSDSSQPETSDDSRRHPTTTTTSTTTSTSTSTSQENCCDNAAGKPPDNHSDRFPIRYFQFDTVQKPFCTPPVGADRIRPQRKAPLRGACAGSTNS